MSRDTNLFLFSDIRTAGSWGMCVCVCVCVCARVCAQPCSTLCDPTDYSPPGSSVHEIFRQDCWSRLPFPSPGDLSNPWIQSVSLVFSALAVKFLTTEPPRKPFWDLGLQKLFYCLSQFSGLQAYIEYIIDLPCSLAYKQDTVGLLSLHM